MTADASRAVKTRRTTVRRNARTGVLERVPPGSELLLSKADLQAYAARGLIETPADEAVNKRLKRLGGDGGGEEGNKEP
jgi:hypothetical protein